jgi:hypothetical protein
VVAIEPYAVSRDGGSGATESGATIPSYPTKRRQHHHSDSCTNALFLIFNRLALLLVYEELDHKQSQAAARPSRQASLSPAGPCVQGPWLIKVIAR